MTGGVLSYERWVARYGELARAELVLGLRAIGADDDLPADASWWEEYLAEALVGATLYEGDTDASENPEVPIMVAEVGLEEASARSLVKNLFGAMFEEGARAYAGTAAGERDEREVLAPYFAVVIEGRRVLYEGEWLLSQLVVDERKGGLRELHGRLAEAVSGWEAVR